MTRSASSFNHSLVSQPYQCLSESVSGTSLVCWVEFSHFCMSRRNILDTSVFSFLVNNDTTMAFGSARATSLRIVSDSCQFSAV